MNVMIVSGHLGEDPALKKTTSGTPFSKFSVAQKNRKRNKTNWFRCVAWGKLAEVVSTNLRKGSGVILQGSMEESVYEVNGSKRRVHELWIDEVDFLPSGGVSSGVPENNENDDIPF